MRGLVPTKCSAIILLDIHFVAFVFFMLTMVEYTWLKLRVFYESIMEDLGKEPY